MNDRALVVRTSALDVWPAISDRPIAEVFQESRLFGIGTIEQLMVIMFKGYELGLSLSAALEFIHVIEGKPSISPKGMLALIQKSGLLADMKIIDEQDKQGNPIACSVTMKRKNGIEYTSRYTIDEAKAAGLLKPNSAWEKYRANMLRWRSVGFCADIVFPDLGGGMYRLEELGANVGADGGVVIEGTAEQIQPPSQPPAPESSSTQGQDFLGKLNDRIERKRTEMPSVQKAVPTVSAPPPEQAAITLNDLVARWGAERIVKALGTIPHNEEEMLEAERRLIAEDKVQKEQESSDESTE